MFKKHQTIRSKAIPSKRHLVIGKSPTGSLILLTQEGKEFLNTNDLRIYEKFLLSKDNYPKAWKKYLSDLKRDRDRKKRDKEYEEMFI